MSKKAIFILIGSFVLSGAIFAQSHPYMEISPEIFKAWKEKADRNQGYNSYLMYLAYSKGVIDPSQGDCIDYYGECTPYIYIKRNENISFKYLKVATEKEVPEALFIKAKHQLEGGFWVQDKESGLNLIRALKGKGYEDAERFLASSEGKRLVAEVNEIIHMRNTKADEEIKKVFIESEPEILEATIAESARVSTEKYHETLKALNAGLEKYQGQEGAEYLPSIQNYLKLKFFRMSQQRPGEHFESALDMMQKNNSSLEFQS